MTDDITTYGPDGHVDYWGHLLRVMRKERGAYTTKEGSIVPRTTKRDVRQVAQWYNAEVNRLISRRGHHHAIHDTWTAAYSRIMAETMSGDLDVEYARNHWFWFQVLGPLAIHMEGERTTPTHMERIRESFGEAVFTDPNTGEIINDLHGAEYRNARDHRGGGGHQSSHSAPGASGSHGAPGGRVVLRHQQRQPVPQQPGPIQTSGEYIAIPKAALAELLPAVGQVWASFLGRPEAPESVNDDVMDRNNAALHRDALAMHQQNQTRILALTDLAARALRLVF